MTDDRERERFAFFDLDLTLVPFDTQLLFCNHVLRAERWRTFYLLVFVPASILHVLRVVGLRGMKRVFLCYLWRMPRERLERHAARFADEVVERLIYGEVAAEVERHRGEGRTTVLCSASPMFYVSEIGGRMGFDRCYGTRVVVRERMPFFPEIEGANNKGAAKLEAMREILGERPAGEVMQDSYAYSDSSADLPMLGLAEHAVMVHPSKSLREAGEARGWREMRPAGRPYGGTWGKLWYYARLAVGFWRG